MKLGDKSVDVILARADCTAGERQYRRVRIPALEAISDHPTLNLSYLKLYAFYLRQESEPKAQRVLSEWFAADPENPRRWRSSAR